MIASEGEKTRSSVHGEWSKKPISGVREKIVFVLSLLCVRVKASRPVARIGANLSQVFPAMSPIGVANTHFELPRPTGSEFYEKSAC